MYTDKENIKLYTRKIIMLEKLYKDNPQFVHVDETYEKNFAEACCRLWAITYDINKGEIVDILCEIGNYSIDKSCEIIALYWKSKQYTLKKYGLIPTKMIWDGKIIRPPPGLEEWRYLKYFSNYVKINPPPGLELCKNYSPSGLEKMPNIVNPILKLFQYI